MKKLSSEEPLSFICCIDPYGEEDWGEENFPTILPIVMKIQAQTVGMNLVSVVSLKPPTCILRKRKPEIIISDIDPYGEEDWGE